MNPDPRCRDAFIAAMAASDYYHDLIDNGFDLPRLEYDEYCVDAKQGGPMAWQWLSTNTTRIYAAWCLLWTPPSDEYKQQADDLTAALLQAETILGKLRKWKAAGRDVMQYGMTHVSLQDLIDLIEALMGQRDEYKQQADDLTAALLQAELRVKDEPKYNGSQP